MPWDAVITSWASFVTGHLQEFWVFVRNLGFPRCAIALAKASGREKLQKYSQVVLLRLESEGTVYEPGRLRRLPS